MASACDLGAQTSADDARAAQKLLLKCERALSPATAPGSNRRIVAHTHPLPSHRPAQPRQRTQSAPASSSAAKEHPGRVRFRNTSENEGWVCRPPSENMQIV